MGSQIEQWFRLADEDRDGGVGGAEAVKFFTKSGLPQDVLGQVNLTSVPAVSKGLSAGGSASPVVAVDLTWFNCFTVLLADLGVRIRRWCKAQHDAIWRCYATGSPGSGAYSKDSVDQQAVGLYEPSKTSAVICLCGSLLTCLVSGLLPKQMAHHLCAHLRMLRWFFKCHKHVLCACRHLATAWTPTKHA